ncbi:uncharacterized protein FTJAE_3350 [Fusarium tjaetaba]|uniref:2EXR domain-containing protein n=1 Tax=Fusarium tjaetaba TaxID=1567544 RepID=A0A8H5W2X9_9HYPO|nr:uncharacterized protein FTJAE_3350 [Fusarium tjaetaba]KAF5643550.1 hypothetical protein FTJAE_3350 [Fusarium tjaetaba]
MATTFHKFPLLPRELREEIWYFAVRSHHRGVQIFQAYKSPSYEGHRATSLRNHILRIYRTSMKASFLANGLLTPARTSIEYNRPWYFGAPLRPKGYVGLEGSLDNIVSTYMIDCGLWTACKESRRVIRKHFANPSNNPWGLPERGSVSYCSGSNPFCLSVWPGSDLFILDFDNFFGTNWGPIEVFPGTPESSPCPVESCKEVGIVYDSIRDNDNPRAWQNVTLAMDFLRLLSLKRHLWLVDTNLKRKRGAASSRDSDTTEFYASDRKFIPVPLEKGEDNMNEWEYLNPVAGGNFRASSIYYAHLANQVAGRLWTSPGYTAVNHGRSPEDWIGLLGWEDLENS